MVCQSPFRPSQNFTLLELFSEPVATVTASESGYPRHQQEPQFEQEAHQLVRPGETLRQSTDNSLKTFRTSLMVILCQAGAELFDSMPVGPVSALLCSVQLILCSLR